MNAPRPLSLHTDLDAGRCLRLLGSPYEIGLQHGQLMRPAIHAFLDDGVARLAALVHSRDRMADWPARIRAYGQIITRCLPHLGEELRGLADGAGLDWEQACLLQLRRELVGYTALPSSGDCTTFGRLHGGGQAVLGQTVDLAGDVAGHVTALDITHQRHGRRVLLLSFTGLMGYLGLNDRGLAIGLNLVLGGQWQPGIPGYMAIRHLLDEADSVQACLDLLRGLPLASSRSLMITDGERLVVVEHILDELKVIEDHTLVHANHFLHPAFGARDELNPFARNSSHKRLRACEEGLATIVSDAPASEYLDLLGRAPIEVPPTADLRRECTVASVLMYPHEGVMHLRRRRPFAA